MGININGNWDILQSNNDTVSLIGINESNGTIHGTAQYPGSSGPVLGELVDNRIHIGINWTSTGARSDYFGTYYPDGRFVGISQYTAPNGVDHDYVLWLSIQSFPNA